MRSIFLRLFASESIKNGISFAFQVSELVANAISGILAGDGLSDERRKQLSTVLVGVLAVRDFLAKLCGIIGANLYTSTSSLESIADKASNLDKITDSI